MKQKQHRECVMKKIFVSAFTFMVLFINTAYSAVWSSMTTDGIQNYFTALDILVSANEEIVRNTWKAQINPVLKDIRKGTTEKKTTLEQISSLESEINIAQKKKVFLLEKEKKLVGVMADVEATKE